MPPGDDKPRPVCSTCGFINYKNPKLVVGCVVTDATNRVLLGRRDIEPRRGAWGLPGGYMESNETLEEGGDVDLIAWSLRLRPFEHRVCHSEISTILFSSNAHGVCYVTELCDQSLQVLRGKRSKKHKRA